MKVRIKATGEIVDLTYNDTLYLDISQEELEEIEIIDDDPDYWTRLEHQYAGMAMQGLLESIGSTTTNEEIAEYSYAIAHALVEKLKEKEERK